ncbi:hypothetical protein Tco_1141780 [Tanacetum coccineum]
MGKIAFYDYHNMVAILEKTEHNSDFHQIVDFLEASYIRYALTVRPTVYVSHIRQFWSTARIETTDAGTKIIAQVYGTQRTIYESSIRKDLKLKDKEGISTLPDAELFENLSLMGYNILPNQKVKAQKTQLSPITHLQLSMNLHPQEDQITSPEPIPQTTTLPSQSHPDISTPRRLTRGAIRISQSKAPTPGEDETLSPTRDDRHRKAFPTATSLYVGQDRENIAKTSDMPYETSPRVTSLGGGEGNLEITQLKNRVKTLEDNEKRSEGFAQEDAPNTEGWIKGRI